MKSDDVAGRSRSYEALVKGTTCRSRAFPESFHVLVKELQALGIYVELGREE